MARRLKHMKHLVYLGLWTSASAEESQQQRRQSMMIVAANARKRRSSVQSSNDMTDAIAMALASMDGSEAKKVVNSSSSVRGDKAHETFSSIDHETEDEASGDHSGAKPEAYRKAFIKSMLHELKKQLVSCDIWIGTK